jgi:hypothetical protein
MCMFVPCLGHLYNPAAPVGKRPLSSANFTLTDLTLNLACVNTVFERERRERTRQVSRIRDETLQRRTANSRSLAAFGATTAHAVSAAYLRTVRIGGPVTVFTVGYERRSMGDLLSRLCDAGVDVLIDAICVI